MPPIIPPLILTLRWSERKKTETHLEKRKYSDIFCILLSTQEWGTLENQWRNPHPRSFLQFDPDHCKFYYFRMITKTNFKLGLCDMDTQNPEELDKLKVVHCAVTVDDMCLYDYLYLYSPSRNLLRSNMLKASFISWICSSVNWSATLVMLSFCPPVTRFLYYFPRKHLLLCVHVSKAPHSM